MKPGSTKFGLEEALYQPVRPFHATNPKAKMQIHRVHTASAGQIEVFDPHVSPASEVFGEIAL